MAEMNKANRLLQFLMGLNNGYDVQESNLGYEAFVIDK